MKKVIFDWGGVILKHGTNCNSAQDAICRAVKAFNSSLSDEEALLVYKNSLIDENGIYISKLNDLDSKKKWVDRVILLGNLNTNFNDFVSKFTYEYTLCDYYKDVVSFIKSIKDKCKICIFSDLIWLCYDALDKQVNLSDFDYTFLSYETHFRKSEIDAFINVENTLNTSCDDIIFVDDTLSNIEIAGSRGWHTVYADGNDFLKIKEEILKFLDN